MESLVSSANSPGRKYLGPNRTLGSPVKYSQLLRQTPIINIKKNNKIIERELHSMKKVKTTRIKVTLK